MHKEILDDELKKKIDSAKIVSFDIYNTLIIRKVNTPEDIFDVIGRNITYPYFRNFRISMQNRASVAAAKETGAPHADIDQIYEQMALYDNSVDWAEVYKLEMQLEYESVVANSEMYAVYSYARQQGKRVIAVSDMYIKAVDLKRFVEKCGYDLDMIYDSADIHKAKFNCELYAYVLEKESVHPQEMLHIGDNYKDDIRNAQEQGIQTYYYMNPDSKDGRYLYEKAMAKYASEKNFSFWKRIGAQVGGPLYTGLYSWLVDELKDHVQGKVYFLARDGYNLYHLFQKNKIVDCQYVFMSRRSLLLAGINVLDEESMQILPPFTLGQTVEEILQYLDIFDICKDSIEEAGFDGPEDRIKDVSDMDSFRKLYRLNETAFLEKCRQEREAAYAYFQKIGFMDDNAIVFDCGWNGSSQYLLDRFLKCVDYQHKTRFCYVGILATDKSKRQLKGKQYETYLFDCDGRDQIQEKLRDSIVLPELFFGAPTPSVIGYKDAEPLFEEENENSDDFKNEIYDGIAWYLDEAYNFVKKYHLPTDAGSAVAEMIRLIEHPTEEEAIEVGNICCVDGFANEKGRKKYIAKLTLEEYRENPRTEIYWVNGLLARPDTEEQLKQELSVSYGVLYNSELAQEEVEIDSDGKKESIEKEESMRRTPVRFIKKKTFENLYQRNTVVADSYQEWIQENEKLKSTNEVCQFEYEPLISFVVPVYNVIDEQLEACVDSVCKQTYQKWELWLIDDCSTWESVRKKLHSYEKYEKIHVVYRKENGNISIATNDGIRRTNGEFIAFMDCDDTVAPNALEDMVALLNRNRELDFIYSDEDKLSEDGKRRHSPFFKPDWSPDTFTSLMYTNHLAIYRTTIVKEVGGLRTEFNGAQDYDFTLRFMEHSTNNRVGHVPKVLYHWRERAESIASDMAAKPYALLAMKSLKEDMLKRRGLDGRVEFIPDMFQYNVIYTAKGNPKVSIVIPSKDNFSYLRRCITSIRTLTQYKNYEIVVVDNGSSDDQKCRIEEFLQKNDAKYIYTPMAFNFSKMCNIGVEAANGEYILLLNDDTEVLQKDWLDRMLGQAMLDYAGAVGAKLLYPGGDLIQHVGITNLSIGPSHGLLRLSDNAIYYFGRNKVNYNWLAVTAACLMISKEKYQEVGGLNENLQVAYNDVDFCFKLYEKGYYNSVRNDVRLLHYESVSRGIDEVDEKKHMRLLAERERLYGNHPQLKGVDPFYNVNMAGNRIDFHIKEDPVYANGKIIRVPNGKELKTAQICVDNISQDGHLHIDGWCSLHSALWDNFGEKYLLLLSSAGKIYEYKMKNLYRPDVAQALGGRCYFTGFSCDVDFGDLMSNIFTYRIGIRVEAFGRSRWQWTDTIIGQSDFINESPKTVTQDAMQTWLKREMRYNIDQRQIHEDEMTISGWSYFESADNLNYVTKVMVTRDNRGYVYDTLPLFREDLALTRPDMYNVYMCGFKASVEFEDSDQIYLVKRDLRDRKVYYSEIRI